MPRMSPALGFLAAAVGGVCLGWVLASARGIPGAEDDVATPRAAPVPAAGAPRLEGVVRTAAADGKGAAAGGASGARTRVSVASEAEVLPVFTLGARPLPEGRGAEVLRALAMLHAALGHAQEYEGLVARGLEWGLDAGDLFALVELLPVQEQLASIDRLLAGPLAGRSMSPVLHARLLAGAGAKGRAVELLVGALDADLDIDVARALIGLDPKRAAAQLDAHAELALVDSDFLGQLSMAWIEAGQAALAWPFLDRIASAGAVPADVLERLAERDPALGLEILGRLMAQRADDGSLLTWLGRMRASARDEAGAFEAFQRAAQRGAGAAALQGMLRVDPQRAYAVARTLDLSGLQGEDRSVLAVLALHAGAAGDAFDALAKGLEQEPGEYSLLNAIVRADPQRSIDLLRERARQYEGDNKDEIVGAYANALRIAGRDAEAREAYLEALSLDDGDAEWVAGLVRLDPARALEALDATKEENSGEEWWQVAQANALMRTGRRTEALAIYNRFEGEESAAAGLGLSDPAEGRRRFDAILAREPNDVDVWIALGEMERELGNVGAARAAFERAVRLEPHNLRGVVRWREVTPAAGRGDAEPAMR